jgi:hydrogenase/urease accessory protein HupE
MLCAHKAIALTALVVIALAATTDVRAHPLAPALLEIVELQEGGAQVRWRMSRLRPRGTDLRPVLPGHCVTSEPPVQEDDPQSLTLRWQIDCGDTPLVGQRITVSGLDRARIDVLVRIELRDGRTVQEILSAGAPSLIVPERQTAAQVANRYGALGVEHILLGVDHLFFVFGLLLLIHGNRQLIGTITSFTLGHSITLSLVALEIATVPAALVELLIALSVLVLAVEAARQGAPESLLRRRPWLMAITFGLLHGMGFAGALREIGLPQEALPLALLAFNVGIEIGQLLFIAGVLGAAWLLREPIERVPGWLRRAPAYAIGSLAAYWCLERASELL